jgi:hypothetical protein
MGRMSEHNSKCVEAWIEATARSGTSLGILIARHPDLVRQILLEGREGIQLVCEAETGPDLAVDDPTELARVLERVGPVEALCDGLTLDPDAALADLVSRFRDLARDRLLFADMRDMSAEVRDGHALLPEDRRQRLKAALADHDFARALCSGAGVEILNSATREAEAGCRRQVSKVVRCHPCTRDLADDEQEAVVQDVFVEMIANRAACKYDTCQAALTTYVTVIAARLCCRSCRESMRELRGILVDLGLSKAASRQFIERVVGPQSAASPRSLADELGRVLVVFWRPSQEHEADGDEPAELIQTLFARAMQRHKIEPESERVYRRLLDLKLLGWPARAIADSVNRDLSPAKKLTENAVDQRWFELKEWMREEAKA